MKKLIALIAVFVVSLIMSSSTPKQRQTRTLFDGPVTARQFNDMCIGQNIPMELNDWIWLRMYWDYEKALDRWMYIKGEDADTLFVLTRYKDKTLHLNIQTRTQTKKGHR